MKCQGWWALGLMLITLTAQASHAPSEPLYIQSDSATFDATTGIAIHRGSVTLSQGQRRLWAEELHVLRSKNGELEEIRAIGSPARYEGVLDAKKPVIHGEALCIVYHLSTQQLILEGKAQLKQAFDTFEGSHIEYDMVTKSINSYGGTKEQTVITLQPR